MDLVGVRPQAFSFPSAIPRAKSNLGGNMDYATPIVEGLAAAGGGALQRVVWEQSEKNGWLLTGGMILGGVLGQAFLKNPLLQQVARASMLSGATVGGWVMAEMNLVKVATIPATDGAFLDAWKAANLTESGRPRVGHLPAYAGNGRRAMGRAVPTAHILDGNQVVERTQI
jgi:hypothetical protein